MEELFKEVEEIKHKYKSHFKRDMPDKIIGWWDPVNIASYPNELKDGVRRMNEDVENAIATNTPFQSIPDDLWDEIIF
ncbi:hypothetical protein OZX68_03600 [Streptococcaceae bacterium ESL0729]|nr:hypothetical protein OZX68_03600 [Streptococcaceae bacterium ESL0729]